ncbi:hypothetical protein NKH72_17005 [Mesorhizobium sp. M0955]|uniref:hypothetical protein n=1 Tax=Mesorhizobium sp. M0955 TaxID=2957033 RepID=UPI003334D997
MNTAFAALLALAATIWSSIQFPIPDGLGFLNFLNGAAVGAGYLSGFEVKGHVSSAMGRVVIYALALVLCVIAALCYAYLVFLEGAGFKIAIEIVISAVAMCYFFSILVGALVSIGALPSE